MNRTTLYRNLIILNHERHLLGQHYLGRHYLLVIANIIICMTLIRFVEGFFGRRIAFQEQFLETRILEYSKHVF